MGIARHAGWRRGNASPIRERTYPGLPQMRSQDRCRMLIGNEKECGETPEGRGFPHPVSFVSNRSMSQSTSTLCLTPIAPSQASANMQYTTIRPFVNSPGTFISCMYRDHAFRLSSGYVLTMVGNLTPRPLSIAMERGVSPEVPWPSPNIRLSRRSLPLSIAMERGLGGEIPLNPAVCSHSSGRTSAGRRLP